MKTKHGKILLHGIRYTLREWQEFMTYYATALGKP